MARAVFHATRHSYSGGSPGSITTQLDAGVHWAIALLLLAGTFSLWAQIATADPGVAGYAVAAFPTSAPDKAERIVDARRKPGPEASQSEVGVLAGCSASTVSRFEAKLKKQGGPKFPVVA
ncbi:hypothetical protein ACWKSP_23775 [Micromonosporaceae bacterium Da 78-11]